MGRIAGMPRLTQRRLANVLGAGALAFGVLGLARPQALARMAATDEETARELGFRDLGNGGLLLASSDPRLAIVQRMLFDASDALLFGRRKPSVAVAALAFAALGAFALTRD
jgi:hypothetical protein